MRATKKSASLNPLYSCANMRGSLHNSKTLTKTTTLTKIVPQVLRNSMEMIQRLPVLFPMGYNALLSYSAGFLSGVVIDLGFVALLGRNGIPGGEILIIPLMIILLFLGWNIGKEYGYKQGHDKGFEDGFIDGYNEVSDVWRL